jgi:hypothetical protein
MEYDTLHKKDGKVPKLTVKDKLDITLNYPREYRTMDSIVAEYDVCKGMVCPSNRWKIPWLKTAHAEESGDKIRILRKSSTYSEYDFKIYKDIIGKGISNSISNSIPLDTDLGYQGTEEYHSNSFIPIKSSKNHELREEEKGYNKELAGRCVVIEHINAKMKTFKSMTYPYREHCRNRHSLSMTLICGIITYDRLV